MSGDAIERAAGYRAALKDAAGVSPAMLAAAWAAWHSRHGGKLGPGPCFVEAIKAALAVAHPSPALKVAVEALALDAAIRAWTDAEPGPDAKSERDGMTAAILAYLATIRAQEG